MANCVLNACLRMWCGYSGYSEHIVNKRTYYILTNYCFIEVVLILYNFVIRCFVEIYCYSKVLEVSSLKFLHRYFLQMVIFFPHLSSTYTSFLSLNVQRWIDILEEDCNALGIEGILNLVSDFSGIASVFNI